MQEMPTVVIRQMMLIKTFGPDAPFLIVVLEINLTPAESFPFMVVI